MSRHAASLPCSCGSSPAQQTPAAAPCFDRLRAWTEVADAYSREASTRRIKVADKVFLRLMRLSRFIGSAGEPSGIGADAATMTLTGKGRCPPDSAVPPAALNAGFAPHCCRSDARGLTSQIGP